MVFDPAALGEALRAECPEVDFILLMGSGRDGWIPPGGDLDLAIGLRDRLTYELRGDRPRCGAVGAWSGCGCGAF